MFGFFGLLNWLVGSVYPVVASYKAYDGYSRLATKTGATTFNVAGVSIPLGTILKKATSKEGEIEEDTINSRLVSVQMWLIYWIVNAAVGTAESVLFLKWLPFYSVLRFSFSVWLISPIILSSSRLINAQSTSYAEIQQEWASFSNQGCGYVYFRVLRPFLEENVGLLNRVSVGPFLASVGEKLIPSLAQFLKLSAFLSRDQTPQSPQSSQTASGYVKSPLSSTGTHVLGSNISIDGDMSEYDVVDKPSSMEESALRNRDVTGSVPATPQDKAAAGGKQSWLW